MRIDNGQEFGSNPMKHFYAARGILHQTSIIDTPQQNGRVESKLNDSAECKFKAARV